MEDIKTAKEVIDMFPDGFDKLYIKNPYAAKCVHFLQQKDDPYFLIDYILKVNQELTERINKVTDYIGNPPNIELK